VFLTSTFVFQTAEQGRDFFDYLAGRRAPPVEGQTGLVYSRFNHPNPEIVEDRLAIHEKAVDPPTHGALKIARRITIKGIDKSRG
jgi:methionine-gamma-lyase